MKNFADQQHLRTLWKENTLHTSILDSELSQQHLQTEPIEDRPITVIEHTFYPIFVDILLSMNKA